LIEAGKLTASTGCAIIRSIATPDRHMEITVTLDRAFDPDIAQVQGGIEQTAIVPTPLLPQKCKQTGAIRVTKSVRNS